MSTRRRQPSGSNDQVILATGGYDHQIRFWQAHSGVCQRTVQHQESQVNDLEITPDRKMIAAAGFQRVRMYDLASTNPNPILNYDGIQKNVTAIGFQQDGKWMFTGSEDNAARIWDLRTRNLNCQRIFQVSNGSVAVNTVCLHPNQVEMFIGDQNGVIHIWDLRTDNNEQLIPENDASIQCISIDREGTCMAAITNKGNCYLWGLSRCNQDTVATPLSSRGKISAHQRYALKCQFSPDSTLLATTSGDGTAKIWRTIDQTELMELKDKNQRWVWDCAFSEDSQYIMTASSDNVARLWNVNSGEVIREYVGHQKAVTCVAFRDIISPD